MDLGQKNPDEYKKMKTGPKYKIARRLGAPIFEKTQTQKYALRQERKGRARGFLKPKSEHSEKDLIETFPLDGDFHVIYLFEMQTAVAACPGFINFLFM